MNLHCRPPPGGSSCRGPQDIRCICGRNLFDVGLTPMDIKVREHAPSEQQVVSRRGAVGFHC